MGFKKRLFSLIYPDVHICVVLEKSLCSILVCKLQGSKRNILERIEFDIKDYKISKDIENFIQLQAIRSPFFYITVLNNSLTQGMIRHDLKDEISFSEMQVINKNNAISYTSLASIAYVKDKFKRCMGVDIFVSSFFILEHIFEDEIKEDGSNSLYVLIQKDRVTVLVIQDGLFAYGNYATTDDDDRRALISDGVPSNTSSNDFDLGEFGLEDGSDEGVEDTTSIMDDLENDIEGLDDLDDTDEEMISSKDKIKDFGDDYKRFDIIKEAVEEFYKKSKYNAKFIEKIYIANGANASDELASFLEDEMFIPCEKKDVDVRDFLINMSISEVLNEA